jgi:hypothetical protein
VSAGCGGGDGGATNGDDQNVVPASKNNLWDQADVCAKVLKANGLARETDSRDGNIRWSCADVPGVTADNNNPRNGFGQEYCEYHALASGKVVTDPSTVSGALTCLFTSVHADATPSTDLVALMADQANLGVKADPTALQMQVGFNSRGAADALIRDCHTAATGNTVKNVLLDEARQAACYMASVQNPAKKSDLQTACKGKDLSAEASWTAVSALGAKVVAPGDAQYEAQRDLAACLGTRRGKGVTWRNSDNMICGRVIREAQECGCNWGGIPSSFQGFPMGGWTSDTKLPDGCRPAKGADGDYTNLVICDVTQKMVQDFVDAGGSNLQTLCHDAFAKDVVLRAPLRVALEKAGSCKGTASVCANQSK